MGSFWSHKNQRNITFFLIFLMLIILFLPEPPQTNKQELSKENFIFNENFNETINNAAEAVDYLYKMQKNQAKIEPIVENRQTFVYNKCRIRNKFRKEIYWKNQTDKWTKVDENLFLFSAFFDPRKNSLFVNHPLIQVQVFLIYFIL